MPFYSVLRQIFLTTVFIPIITLFSYGFLLLYYNNKTKNNRNNELTTYPQISILIPTRARTNFELIRFDERMGYSIAIQAGINARAICQIFVSRVGHDKIVRVESTRRTISKKQNGISG